MNLTSLGFQSFCLFVYPYKCIIFIFSFIVVLGGGTLWHLQRLLPCIKYVILEFTPSTSHFYPPFQVQVQGRGWGWYQWEGGGGRESGRRVNVVPNMCTYFPSLSSLFPLPPLPAFRAFYLFIVCAVLGLNSSESTC
jgi:hypothetical protein